MEQKVSLLKTETIKELNESVVSVIGADGLIMFEKAYLIANAAQKLKGLLTKEYMSPIMALQGNKLGFKTDRDDKGGYSEEEWRESFRAGFRYGIFKEGVEPDEDLYITSIKPKIVVETEITLIESLGIKVNKPITFIKDGVTYFKIKQ